MRAGELRVLRDVFEWRQDGREFSTAQRVDDGGDVALGTVERGKVFCTTQAEARLLTCLARSICSGVSLDDLTRLKAG